MRNTITSVMSILVVILFLSGCGQKQAAPSTTTVQGQQAAAGPLKCNDMPCLGQNFRSCTPAELLMSSGGQSVTITIHGFENERCHFTMVFGNVTAGDCYFKKENLNNQVLNQLFGNKEGQDAVIAEACGQ